MGRFLQLKQYHLSTSQQTVPETRMKPRDDPRAPRALVRISGLQPEKSRLPVCLYTSPMGEAGGLGNLGVCKRDLSLQLQDSHSFG